MKQVVFRIALASTLVWFLPAVRQAAEANMAVHMLAHLPSIAVCGALLAAELPGAVLRGYAKADWLGVGSMIFSLCALSFWMIPVALDASLMSPSIAWVKYLSLLLAGAMLHAAWRRFPPALMLFLLGNAAGMTATAGLLQQAESRLCASYVLDQQAVTGSGLLAWAGLMACCAIWSWFEFESKSAGEPAVTALQKAP